MPGTIYRMTNMASAESTDSHGWERWRQGLELHLAHQSLTFVLSKVGQATQWYVLLHPCPSCTEAGCTAMCHTSLFRQLVRTSLPHVQLERVPDGLKPIQWGQVVQAVPTPTARWVPADGWDAWEELRLCVTMHTQKRQPVAILQIGAVHAPPLPTLLNAHGWRVMQQNTRTLRRNLTAAVLAPPTATVCLPDRCAPASLFGDTTGNGIAEIPLVQPVQSAQTVQEHPHTRVGAGAFIQRLLRGGGSR